MMITVMVRMNVLDGRPGHHEDYVIAKRMRLAGIPHKGDLIPAGSRRLEVIAAEFTDGDEVAVAWLVNAFPRNPGEISQIGELITVYGWSRHDGE